MRTIFSGLASAKLCSHLTHLSSFRIVFLEVVLVIRSSYLVRHCGRRRGRRHCRHCHRPDLSAQSALCTFAVTATSGSRTERNILVLRSCALVSPRRCRHRSTLDGHARICRAVAHVRRRGARRIPWVGPTAGRLGGAPASARATPHRAQHPCPSLLRARLATVTLLPPPKHPRWPRPNLPGRRACVPPRRSAHPMGRADGWSTWKRAGFGEGGSKST